LAGLQSVNTTNSSLSAQSSGHIQNIIVWEFTLPSLSAGESIVEVLFNGTQQIASGIDATTDLTLEGYVGDGIVDAGDRLIGSTITRTSLYTTNIPTTAIDQSFSFELGGLSFFNTFGASDGNLAINASVPSFDTWNVASNENTTYDGVTLEITTVPEPAQYTLICALTGLAIVIARRRRVVCTRSNGS